MEKVESKGNVQKNLNQNKNQIVKNNNANITKNKIMIQKENQHDIVTRNTVKNSNSTRTNNFKTDNLSLKKNNINKNIDNNKPVNNNLNNNKINDNIKVNNTKLNNMKINNAKINNTIINNTKIDQETKIYNFKEELKNQRKNIENNSNKSVQGKSQILNNSGINSNLNNNLKVNNNSNIKNKTNNNLNKSVNQTANKAIKEAQKIVNNANLKDNKENKTEKNKKRKGLIIFLIIIIIALFSIIISTVFALLNKNNTKIIQGVHINNINVSNLSKEEAITKLENELNNNENNYIIVNYKNISKKIYLNDINGKFDVKDAVNVAYKVGRDNTFIHNNYKILFTSFLKENLDITFTYDEELLQKQIDLISLELPGVATDSSYVIDGNNLVIKNSKDGIQIKKEEFTNNLVNSFKNEEKSFEISVEKCEKKEIDIELIHSEIYKPAKNATYTTEPYAIYKEENGLDFAITIEEAKQLLKEEKEEYIIPLKVLKPKITVSKLESAAFPNKLGSFTTYYSASDVNRNANIALAAKSITSVVLMQGEVFSYNNLIGECSTRTGYKESTIYLNGELAKGVGGGICQVSTTLYNAVLRANLEIVQRRNHSLSVTYVPLGHDAMVSIGSQDFQFKNNRDYPIRVVATTGPTSITCQIMGLAEEKEYDVKLYSRVISKTETKTKVETYKLLYLNGVEVSRTWLSTDTYKNH